MRKPFLFLLFLVWVIAISALLTRFWLLYPDYFPAVPVSVAEYLASLYGAQNAEQVADLELLIGFGVSIPLVALITWAGLRLAGRRA
ncbi:hypothetical protein ACRQ1B_22695 [Rhizobium panacihumi]|uniref:hypothetical protein n=1 Tax=Rhizobium panacihumi TaxID=2008450 RepID=UPI003D78F84F